MEVTLTQDEAERLQERFIPFGARVLLEFIPREGVILMPDNVDRAAIQPWALVSAVGPECKWAAPGMKVPLPHGPGIALVKVAGREMGVCYEAELMGQLAPADPDGVAASVLERVRQ